MKMKLLMCLVLLGLISVQASDELKINGDFLGSRIGDVSPKRWYKNHDKNPNIGVSKVVQGEKAGEFALNVKTTKVETAFYSWECPGKVGENLEIEAEVTGKGSFRLGYYAYDAKHAYVGSLHGNKITVQPGEDDYKTTLQVRNFPGKNAVKYIRVAFSTYPGSDLTFSEVKAEYEDKD